ncbi:hypothetical protein [Pseudonocardia sp. N23]|uniref:hypothetical protein n=1 Tax=Pseudonocardia sp. N23 TaxID=1987376 RepID=UPI001145607F|nr:hypothetical protein [Pseudonocardia sp. N23]
MLLVVSRGGTGVRLALEAELSRRGWPIAAGPADADVLLVAGAPGPELGSALDAVWAAIPQPRTHATILDAARVAVELDRAAAELVAGHPMTGPLPSQTTVDGGPVRSGEVTDRDDAPHVHRSAHGEHSDHTKHAGHGGHGEMRMPGGLPMADLGQDRDGLTLDQLQVTLGPVLSDWPAGLVLAVVLQGDVVQRAHARLVDDPLSLPFWSSDTPMTDTDRGDAADPSRHAAARELDAIARFLAVAGWPAPATRARRLRDELLAGASPEPMCAAAEALCRQVRRSRTLRRMLRGLPHALDLLTVRLEALGQAIVALRGPAGMAATPEERRPTTVSAAAREHAGSPLRSRLNLDELERLLVGTDLATARLLIAGADPITDEDSDRTGGSAPHAAAAVPARRPEQAVPVGTDGRDGEGEAPSAGHDSRHSHE